MCWLGEVSTLRIKYPKGLDTSRVFLVNNKLGCKTFQLTNGLAFLDGRVQLPIPPSTVVGVRDESSEVYGWYPQNLLGTSYRLYFGRGCCITNVISTFQLSVLLLRLPSPEMLVRLS